MVVGLGRSDAARLSAPGHDDGGCVEVAAFEDFVPSDNGLALTAQVLFDTDNDIGLQLCLAGVALGLHTCLTAVALFPFAARTFVAADVEILAGEELHHFVNDILQEGEHPLLAGAHHHVLHAPDNARCGGFSAAGEFGIGGNGGQFVAWDFQFGHHLNVSLAGVFHDFANLLLGVESLMDGAVTLHAARAHLGQARILLDFDAPALVFGQVPMQVVNLVGGQHVYLTLHGIDRQEVATGVEHHAAIGEAGCVVNLGHGNLPCFHLGQLLLAFHFGRQQLEQRLHGVEQAIGSRGLGHNAVAGDGELIGFAAFDAGVQFQCDGARGSHLAFPQGEACRALNLLCEILRHFFGFLVLVGQTRVGVEGEMPLSHLGVLRSRDDVEGLCRECA